MEKLENSDRSGVIYKAFQCGLFFSPACSTSRNKHQEKSNSRVQKKRKKKNSEFYCVWLWRGRSRKTRWWQWKPGALCFCERRCHDSVFFCHNQRQRARASQIQKPQSMELWKNWWKTTSRPLRGTRKRADQRLPLSATASLILFD